MKIALTILSLFAASLLAWFLYQQGFVEGEFGPAAIIGTIVLGAATVVLVIMAYLAGTRHREAVRNWSLAVTVAVFAYLAVDFIAGRLLIVPLSPPLVPNQYRHHALVPDTSAEFHQRDFHYVQRVNKLGLRGRETSLEKPEHTWRILMLGDSFTMGKGVEDDETFSVLVEEMLNEELRACGAGQVEVLNGGVDSYAPILSYIQFARELRHFDPDLVVLNLDNSDLIQEQAYRQQGVRDETGKIVAVPQIGQDSVYEKLHSWTARNLYFTRILLVYAVRAMDHKEISVRRVVNEFGREHFAHTLEHDVDRTEQWQDIFDSTARIKQTADSVGAGFLLATYPWAHQVNDTDWIPGRYAYMAKEEHTSTLTQETIRKYAEDLGMDLYEALPVFLEHQGAEPLYFRFDPHWTPLGHEVMAGGIAQHIREHYALEMCDSS